MFHLAVWVDCTNIEVLWQVCALGCPWHHKNTHTWQEYVMDQRVTPLQALKSTIFSCLGLLWSVGRNIHGCINHGQAELQKKKTTMHWFQFFALNSFNSISKKLSQVSSYFVYTLLPAKVAWVFKEASKSCILGSCCHSQCWHPIPELHLDSQMLFFPYGSILMCQGRQ